MRPESNAAGLAALSILLSLTANKVINDTEAKAILGDAATAHHEAALLQEGGSEVHAEAAALIEAIITHGNSVRHTVRESSSELP